jgi:23S rRNA pseudoU1915 N3-methylase RlmH
MILPHSLAFTVLLEQIYRCSEIERGSSYHK